MNHINDKLWYICNDLQCKVVFIKLLPQHFLMRSKILYDSYLFLPGIYRSTVVSNLFRTTDRFETELFLRTGL